jgi:hypothetical protein
MRPQRRATGPTTAEGKAVSSRNALRHGLTAEPSAGSVEAWFNIILDSPAGVFEEPSSSDPLREATLRLAVAEVRYHRALHVLSTHAMAPKSARQAANKVHTEMRTALDHREAVSAGAPPDLATLDYLDLMLEKLEPLTAEAERDRRLHERYLGEARSERRQALRAWCEFNTPAKKNPRNELRDQPNGD